MKTKLVLFIILLFVIGCASTEKKSAQSDDGAIVIDVNSALKGEGRNFEDMIESVELIPLETTEASVVGHIHKGIVTDQYIYVSDFYENYERLSIFDRSGKFVKSFTRGNSAEEFPFIADYFYADGNLYIATKNKMLKYTDKGVFVEAKLFDYDVVDINKIGDGFVIVQAASQNKEQKHKIIKLDSNLAKVSEHSLDPIVFYNIYDLDCFDEDNCLIFTFADNNIYDFSGNDFKVKYRLDFPDYESDFPYEKFKDPQHASIAVLEEIQESKYLFSGQIKNSKDYLMLNMFGKTEGDNISKYVFFNKNTGKVWAQNYCSARTPLCYLDRNGIVNLSRQKNTFCGILSSYFAEKTYDTNTNNLFSAKDIEILKNAKEDDNPIIVIYKLKDNL